MDKLKEKIRAKIKEMSATGQGGASFTPGQGEGYATPAAFASKTNSKGTKNIYYYKLGFKPAPTPHPKPPPRSPRYLATALSTVAPSATSSQSRALPPPHRF